MADPSDLNCPKPASHDSHQALPPSGLPGKPEVDPPDPGSPFLGYQDSERSNDWMDRELALLTEPKPGSS